MQSPVSNDDVNVNPVSAQTAVVLSHVTYLADPVKEISRYLHTWNIVWNGIETVDGNYAFVAKDTSSNTYALAIRGSLPVGQVFKNWYTFANWVIEDLDVATTVPWPYAATNDPRISNGANVSFDNLVTMQDSMLSGLDVTQYLLKYVFNSNATLLITGHSLGGNMANVYASYFVSTIANTTYAQNKLWLYTFAAPGAGNKAYASDLDAKLPNAWHYHNDLDIVPAYPVGALVGEISLLYDPAPAAVKINVVVDGKNFSLRDLFLVQAGVFWELGYTQQTNHYTIFAGTLNPVYARNTVDDFFGQAGTQHAVVTYARHLGIDEELLASAEII